MGIHKRENTVMISKARLKYLADIAGMNMTNFSESMQVNRDNIYRWCRDGWELEWAEWAADILGVCLEDLIEGD